MRLQYTVNFKRAAEDIEQKVQYAGNSTKALRLSVDASLKKLRTEYIDILYLHMVSPESSYRCRHIPHLAQWNWDTSVQEVMSSLHNLVVSGKVLYLVSHGLCRCALCTTSAHCGSQGISDTPAWIVSKANLYARITGKTPFVVYQGSWNVMQRDFERDIIPMALSEGEPYRYP